MTGYAANAFVVIEELAVGTRMLHRGDDIIVETIAATLVLLEGALHELGHAVVHADSPRKWA